MAIALSNSLDKTEQNAIKLVKMKAKDQTPNLLLYDKQDRERILADRLSAILENQINFNESSVASVTSTFLVKTKFSSLNNYLWNKCKYFNQANESFYVEIFVTKSNVKVGGQLFATKEDQVCIIIASERLLKNKATLLNPNYCVLLYCVKL
jgi:hypothetical protein